MHAQAAAPPGPEIRDVRLRGVAALPATVVETALAARPTRCRSPVFFIGCLLGVEGALDRSFLVDPAVVEQDAARIAQLYEYWGYPRASAEGRVVDRGDNVVIEYRVTEGPPLLVESVQLQWAAGLTPPELPDPLPLRAGAPYAIPRVAATEEVIRDALAGLGHPQPAFEAGGEIDEANLRARVVLAVDPGPQAWFEAPELQLAPPLTEPFVRPRLAVQPGLPYRLSTLERMEAELYALPIVEQVFTATRALPGDTVVYSTVRVVTRQRLGYEVGGTVSSARCLELGAAGRDRFALGGPRMLTASVSFSNLLAGEGRGFPCATPVAGAYADPDYRVQLELVQPWAGDARNTLLLRGFGRRETAPLVYVQRGFGGEVALTRELGRELGALTATLGWAPRRDELDAVGLYFCANYALCEPGQLAEFEAPRWLAPAQFSLRSMTAGYGRLVRPPPLQGLEWLPGPPRLRHRTSLVVDGADAATGSDYSYGRVQLDAALARTVGRDVELGLRGRAAAITGDGVLPPQVRLFSGGVVSVRGVPQNMLGPRMAVIPADEVPPGCAPPCDLGILPTDGRNLRPIGGDRVLEAGLEARLWVADGLQLAAFADAGWITRTEAVGGVADVDRSEAVVTPGFGLRVLSPMGPIRIDFGWDPRGPRRYPVFSEAPDGSVVLVGTGVFDPFTYDDPSTFRQFIRRFQLQLGVGPSF